MFEVLLRFVILNKSVDITLNRSFLYKKEYMLFELG